MRILVLGGTQFLGRHVVDAALERGHGVTLFNRGQTRPELFPDVEKLHGDRDGDLSALEGRAFDAVVDTSGYVPRIVQHTLDALGDVGHYTFVSSVSAYADLAEPRDEDAPLAQLTEETEDYRSEAYGPLKALCEDVVRARFPGAFIPRPGLIGGPWDPTGRFTYWPQRFAAGGQVLAPTPADGDTQVIDARDLAHWIVEAAETGLAGDLQRGRRSDAASGAARDLPGRDRRRVGDRLGRRRVPRRARGRAVDGAADVAARAGVRGDAEHAARPRTRRRPRVPGRSRRRRATRSRGYRAARHPRSPAGLDRERSDRYLTPGSRKTSFERSLSIAPSL